jgi:hypothetical protein
MKTKYELINIVNGTVEATLKDKPLHEIEALFKESQSLDTLQGYIILQKVGGRLINSFYC